MSAPSYGGGGEVPCFARIGVHGDRSCEKLVEFVHCLRCPVFAETAHDLFDRPPPPGYRSEWTERLAAPPEAELGEATSYVTIRIGTEWLGLRSSMCIEVTESRRAFPLPHRAGGAFQGLVNVRGQSLLAVALGTLLDVRSEEGKGGRARLVVVEGPDGRYALRVDEVDRVRRFANADVLDPPTTLSHALTAHVRGVVRDGERLVGLIDAPTLLSTLARCVS